MAQMETELSHSSTGSRIQNKNWYYSYILIKYIFIFESIIYIYQPLTYSYEEVLNVPAVLVVTVIGLHAHSIQSSLSFRVNLVFMEMSHHCSNQMHTFKVANAH